MADDHHFSLLLCHQPKSLWAMAGAICKDETGRFSNLSAHTFFFLMKKRKDQKRLEFITHRLETETHIRARSRGLGEQRALSQITSTSSPKALSKLISLISKPSARMRCGESQVGSSVSPDSSADMESKTEPGACS